MSTHGHETGLQPHAVGNTRLFMIVWIWLVAITGFEVFLAYLRLQPVPMLTLLVILSMAKAGMIVAYFMHLKYEKLSLALMLVPSTLFCICMIIIFFMPDGLRALQLRGH